MSTNSVQLNVIPNDSNNAPILSDFVVDLQTVDAADWGQPGLIIFPSQRGQTNFVDSAAPVKAVAVAGTVRATGYKEATFGPVVWDGKSVLNIPVTCSFKRPAAKKQSPLPAFDPSDSGGVVHTTPPPELVIPPAPDNLFMRADFNGVNLNAARWGGNPPMMQGANTTPITMLMSPMVILYPRKWQDAHLTESAERNYSHYIITGDGWNLTANGFNPTPAAIVTWASYVKSWGFKVVYWRSTPQLGDPILQALVSAGVVDWSIPGEEVDSKVTSEQYDAILNDTLAITANGIPVGAHFTANYPSGFPRDTFLTDWSPYDGKVHLCWQADNNDSAGTQGARLYYARQRVNLGLVGDGQYSNPAPNCRVYAYETMASSQLMGRCTEEYGNLRSLELLYTTRVDSRIRPMAGFGNGCRYPDGTPI